jgi:hypothetical protein
MRPNRWAIALAALAAMAVSGAADAAPKRKAFKPSVTIVGCPRPGVEAGCVMMNQGSTVYNVTSGNVPAFSVFPIQLTGTPSSLVTTCQQGIPLTSITWHHVHGFCGVLPWPYLAQ